MSDINQVIIIGNLARDPELRTLPSGSSVCSFNIANNFTYVKDGEKKSEASFFKCTAWGKTAEVVAQYVKKGDRVVVTADNVRTNAWESAEGDLRSSIEVSARRVDFSGNKRREEQYETDDIPF